MSNDYGMGSSPWGSIDHKEEIMPGCAWVGTPGHGGLRVSQGLAEHRMTPEGLKASIHQSGYYWFEEDCQWAIAAYEIREVFQFLKCSMADVISALQWNPEYLISRGLIHLLNRENLIRNIDQYEKWNDTRQLALYKGYLETLDKFLSMETVPTPPTLDRGGTPYRKVDLWGRVQETGLIIDGVCIPNQPGQKQLTLF